MDSLNKINESKLSVDEKLLIIISCFIQIINFLINKKIIFFRELLINFILFINLY